MNINNKSLGLISSVFAITLGSANPATACDWFGCCGDDEADSETTRLNIHSKESSFDNDSLANQIIINIGEQANKLSLNEGKKQELLQLEKEELLRLQEQTEQKAQLIEETKRLKALRKEEEKKVATEREALLQKNAELDRQIEALKTPIKFKQLSRIVTETPTEEETTSISTPMPEITPSTSEVSKPVNLTSSSTSYQEQEAFSNSYSDTEESSEAQPLSKHQEAIVNLDLKDQVSPQIWNHLAEDKPLSKALLSAIQDLDPSLLTSSDAIIGIGFLSTDKFKLKIGSTTINKFYTF